MVSSKAKTLDEIPAVIQYNIPVPPAHPFFTDFAGLRAKFLDQIHKRLHYKDGKFNYELYSYTKPTIFIAGFRGSGKTTELLRLKEELDHPNGFYVIFCPIDEHLDINDLEYMDILIFKIERLIDRLHKDKVKIKDAILKDLNTWFTERVVEINKKIAAEGGFTIELEAKSPDILKYLLSLVGKLKLSLTATKENAEIIRKTFRYRFNDFAEKFNLFVEYVNQAIRNKAKGNEVLFIIDGLEKTLTAQIRRRIIRDEANRINKIKAYTIFTLPLELKRERNILIQDFQVISFPFIKIEDEHGNKISVAYQKFREFIFRRIDQSLFEDDELVDKIIHFSGGSPREALRIIDYAVLNLADDDKLLTHKAVDQGLHQLANEMSVYLTEEELEKLRLINKANEQGLSVPYDDVIQQMLEELIIMEYNDGSLKKPNPVITLSKIYKEYVEPS